MTLPEAFSAQKPALQIWVIWMFGINFCSIFFLRQREARWVLAAMLVNLLWMGALMQVYGRGHHMSLPHVIIWTPLLFYLARRYRAIAGRRTVYAAWTGLVVITIAISLVMDYHNLWNWLAA
ncbi:MAG: hypothetical protein R3E50_04030 [Halioglobus sp.]